MGDGKWETWQWVVWCGRVEMGGIGGRFDSQQVK
jgi:hypothetical protein